MALNLGTIHQDFTLDINQLELSLDRFTLGDRDNHFKAIIRTQQGESMRLDGLYNHQQKIFNSDLKLTDVKATNLNQILPNELNTMTSSGVIHAHGQVNWSLDQKPVVKLFQIEVMDLQSDWQQQLDSKALNINLRDILIDLATQTVTIEQITSTAGQWQVNWPFEQPLYSGVGNAEVDLNDKANPTNRWHVAVNTIDIQDWPIQVIDSSLNASFPLLLNSLKIKGFNTRNSIINFNGQLDIDQQGKLNLNGNLTPSPLSIDAEINISALRLSSFNPWLRDATGMQVNDGILTAEQRLSYNDDGFILIGGLLINAFELAHVDDGVLARGNQLSIAATSVNSNNKTIKLDQLTLDQASGSWPDTADSSYESYQSHLEPSSKKYNKKSTNNPWTIIIGGIESVKK